jgi:nickel superoxide dismutase
MFKKIVVTVMMLFAGIAMFAHCQVPCGIYDDGMRLDAIQEDIVTIEKSINEIVRIQNEKIIDYNQLVRWINTKDKHAGNIQATVTEYFMTQRVKPVADKNSPEYAVYVKKITILHEIIISAMKCKQSLALQNVSKLRSLSLELNSIFEHKH